MMNHFFHVNGPVFTFLSKFCDVLIISILWTLFCLPVVTVGPACAALYHTVHKSLLKSDGFLPAFSNPFHLNSFLRRQNGLQRQADEGIIVKWGKETISRIRG